MNDKQEGGSQASPPAVSSGGAEPQTTEYNYPFEEHLKIYAKRKYALFLTILGDQLSENEAAQLESILVDRELIVNSRQRPPEKDYLPRQRKKFDLQIRTEFGDDIADAVTTYLKHSPTRGFLARVNMLLIYAGDPLSVEQIDRLCLIFAAHPAPQRPRQIKSIAEAKTYLEQRIARDRAVIIEAGDSLSPVQLNVLSEEMKFQLSYTKVGLARTSSAQ